MARERSDSEAGVTAMSGDSNGYANLEVEVRGRGNIFRGRSRGRLLVLMSFMFFVSAMISPPSGYSALAVPSASFLCDAALEALSLFVDIMEEWSYA